LLLRYNGHSERALFCITGLGRQNLILGHTWLKEHNPEVDWRTGKVEMSRCSPRCCNRCRTEAREERRTLKQEAASISACRSGSFPATVEDAEEEDASDDESTPSDIPFDIEEGDHVWATGLIPEAQYVQVTSTISQRLAESFARNSEANPTLPTGGSGLDKSFRKRDLRNSRTTNHGITPSNWYRGPNQRVARSTRYRLLNNWNSTAS
jgi:hypothetical protein